MKTERSIELLWAGPFGWPNRQGDLPVAAQRSGVYLLTFEYRKGYLIYAAGFTRRPIQKRLREHTRKYMSGDYNVLDMAAIRRGLRKVVWHGWGWSEEKRRVFEERQAAILDAVRKQLEAFRIFVAEVSTEDRIPERIEAAIMGRLGQARRPLRDIPDEGMHLAPRWKSERAVIVTNICPVKLYGLPARMEI